MRFKALLPLAIAAGLPAFFSGCASPAPSAPQGLSAAAAEQDRLCGRCGRVRLIQFVDSRPAVVAPAGGVLSEVGGGLIPGTRAGEAVGGVERVTVTMDRGGMEVLELPAPSGLRQGDRVRLRGSTVEILNDGP